MELRPLISAIVPVYNGEAYLQAALQSVLGQTYPSVDTIVVDDGSADASAGVVERLQRPVRYAYQPQRGAAAARNLGCELARGSLLAFLDADDLWVADKLERQMAVFASEPETDLVFGHVQQFVSPDPAAGGAGSLRVAPRPMPGRVAGTMLVRRESFARVGPFDTRLRTGETIDWCLRAQDLGLCTVILPDVLLLRRLHQRNHGILRRDTRIDYARVLKDALDRRRAAGMGPQSAETADRETLGKRQ